MGSAEPPETPGEWTAAALEYARQADVLEEAEKVLAEHWGGYGTARAVLRDGARQLRALARKAQRKGQR